MSIILFVACLVLSVGIGTCEEVAPKGPYWRDIKYGQRGFSFHGLKFGGVYTDEDFKFSDDSQKKLHSRHATLDENNSLVSHTVPAILSPVHNDTTPERSYEIYVSNDIDDEREVYIPALEKQSHIIDPPAIVPEPSVEKAQEVIYVGKVENKDEGPTRGDGCILCETDTLLVRDKTDVDDTQYTAKPSFVTESHIDDSQYTTHPTFVTESHIDDSQYTTKPTFVTESHIDDSQYTTHPTFVTESHIDDSQYTTHPTFVTETHIDDSQYTTKPTFVTETHIDDTQYTTKPTFVTETHIDDSQYTTKPAFVTVSHIDDSQYTTKPTVVTESHIDDSQYATHPTFVTESHIDDSQYTTKPTFVTESHIDDSQYTTKPTVVTESHIDDSQYTTHPTFNTESHIDDSQYTTKPTFVTKSHIDDSQYTTKPTFVTESHIDDSQYTTHPTFLTTLTEKTHHTTHSYIPETTKTPYVHTPVTSIDEWVWETGQTSQPTIASTTTSPRVLFHPLIPVLPTDHSFKHPPTLIPAGPHREGGFSGVEFHISGSNGYGYTINHGSGLKTPESVFPATFSYPSFNYHTVSTSKPTYSTEVQTPKGHEKTHYYTTVIPEVQYTTIAPGPFTVKDTHEATTPPFIHPTLYPIFLVTEVDTSNVKGIRKHLTTAIPTTIKPIYETESPTTIKTYYSTEHPLKHDHPTTVKPIYETTWTDSTTAGTTRPHYDVTTLVDKYDVPSTQPTIYITNRSFYSTETPATSESTPTRIDLKGHETTFVPHIPVTTTEVTVKTGIPTTYYPASYDTTPENHNIYTTLNPHLETTPFFTTEVPFVKGQSTTYPSITTEIPVIKEETTYTPIISTTKPTGIKGHRRFFITPSTTDYPITPRMRGIKGNKRFSFATLEKNETPVLPAVRKTGVKGYRRFSEALITNTPSEDLPVGSLELSEEFSSDKNARLSNGNHFYFAPRRQIRDVSDTDVEEFEIVKGIRYPLKRTSIQESEAYGRGLQQDVKGHATYDIKRPDIKGRSGDRWKKFFNVNHNNMLFAREM